jgi:Glycosyltransferase family 92
MFRGVIARSAKAAVINPSRHHDAAANSTCTTPSKVTGFLQRYVVTLVMLTTVVCGIIMLYFADAEYKYLFTASSRCGFQRYPNPKHHQGLPFLAEVFAADNGQSVYFVALNKGPCLEEWKYAQEFHSNTTERNYFMCRFPDGRMVKSDPIHEKWAGDNDWSNAVIVIRCDIPKKYQSWVKEPSSRTRLFVDLYATKDLEAFPVVHVPISPATSYQKVPVCHAEWGEETLRQSTGLSLPTATVARKNYYLSMVTKIKLSYCPHEGGGCKSPSDLIQTDPRQVIAWIEHHHAIGFEHFYVYNNEPEPHGTLLEILQPYIITGLVTLVWYPLEDCIVDYDSNSKKVGDRFTDSQAAATSAALRRFAHRTTYLAHFDIDEYIIPPTGVSNLQSIIKDNEDYDWISLELTWFRPCRNEVPSNNKFAFPFDSAHCYNKDATPWKSIMKTSRILAFFVHVPFATVDGSVATNGTHLSDILVAHYRSQRLRDTDSKSVLMRSNAMDMYAPRIRECVEAHMASILQ